MSTDLEPAVIKDHNGEAIGSPQQQQPDHEPVTTSPSSQQQGPQHQLDAGGQTIWSSDEDEFETNIIRSADDEPIIIKVRRSTASTGNDAGPSSSSAAMDVEKVPEEEEVMVPQAPSSLQPGRRDQVQLAELGRLSARPGYDPGYETEGDDLDDDELKPVRCCCCNCNCCVAHVAVRCFRWLTRNPACCNQIRVHARSSPARISS